MRKQFSLRRLGRLRCGLLLLLQASRYMAGVPCMSVWLMHELLGLMRPTSGRRTPSVQIRRGSLTCNFTCVSRALHSACPWVI